MKNQTREIQEMVAPTVKTLADLKLQNVLLALPIVSYCTDTVPSESILNNGIALGLIIFEDRKGNKASFDTASFHYNEIDKKVYATITPQTCKNEGCSTLGAVTSINALEELNISVYARFASDVSGDIEFDGAYLTNDCDKSIIKEIEIDE